MVIFKKTQNCQLLLTLSPHRYIQYNMSEFASHEFTLNHEGYLLFSRTYEPQINNTFYAIGLTPRMISVLWKSIPSQVPVDCDREYFSEMLRTRILDFRGMDIFSLFLYTLY